MQNPDVAERLMLYRADRGWTQIEVARRAGVHDSTISLIESGHHVPRRITLVKLAMAFGVRLEEFLSDRPPKASGPSVVERSLLDGPGHKHLTKSPEEAVEEAEGMSVPEILVRLEEITAERDHLRALKPSEFPDPKEAKAEIRHVRRNFVPLVMELVAVADRKAKAAALSEEEMDRALDDIQRAAVVTLQEANVQA